MKGEQTADRVGIDADFWKHIKKRNKKRAEESLAGWTSMLETRETFLEKLIPASEALTELSKFMEHSPTCYVNLQAELKRVIELTNWSIKECKMNTGFAKKRLKGSE